MSVPGQEGRCPAGAGAARAGARFTPPPVPVQLARRPLLGGLAVPYISLQHRNGAAAMGAVNPALVEQCLRARLCGACGEPVPDRMVFLMRGQDLARALSNEPGLHPQCAAYTRRACPMVGGFMERYRGSVSPAAVRRCGDDLCGCRIWAAPGQGGPRAGAPADRWHALWTMRYRLERDPEGRLAAGFAGLRVLALREVPAQGGDEAGR